jgi:hypothetical protein
MRIGHLNRHTGMRKALSVESTHINFPHAELFTRRRPDPHKLRDARARYSAPATETIPFRLLFVHERAFRRLSKPLPLTPPSLNDPPSAGRGWAAHAFRNASSRLEPWPAAVARAFCFAANCALASCILLCRHAPRAFSTSSGASSRA